MSVMASVQNNNTSILIVFNVMKCDELPKVFELLGCVLQDECECMQNERDIST